MTTVYRSDAQSVGHGARVTACGSCGVPVFNDWPYYKRQWADEGKSTGCQKAQDGWHHPAPNWDKRRPT